MLNSVESQNNNRENILMLTITRVSKAMQELLLDKANELGEKTGFTERHRVLSGSSFIMGLISGWQADPQASLAGLSQAVSNAGTPISRQGLDFRFDEKAVNFVREVLKASLELTVKAMPVEAGLLSRFASVELLDSSVISLPNELSQTWRGAGGFGENARIAALKLNLRWDVRSGELRELDLTSATEHDRQSQAYQLSVQAGGLQLGDLGYFKLADFAAIEQAGAYYLSRYKTRTKVFDLAGHLLDLKTWLPERIGQKIDKQVLVGAAEKLPARLVAERVPLAILAQRHERLKEIARQNQSEVSQEALEMAKWTIYLCNIPQNLLASAEIFVLGRYRWQIELLFKLWKSDLELDNWASRKPERILVELYTKLIGAIVAHWLLLVACWHNPRRSLRQAIPTLRGLAWQFANSLCSISLLQHAIRAFCRALETCKMDKSRLKPRAFQLIHAQVA